MSALTPILIAIAYSTAPRTALGMPLCSAIAIPAGTDFLPRANKTADRRAGDYSRNQTERIGAIRLKGKFIADQFTDDEQTENDGSFPRSQWIIFKSAIFSNQCKITQQQLKSARRDIRY